MKYILVIFISLLIGSLSAQDSEPINYKVHLKNGSVITGILLSSETSEKVKVQSGNNIWVFKKEEVARLEIISTPTGERNSEKEEVASSSNQAKSVAKLIYNKENLIKEKGLFFGLGGSLMGGNSGNSFDINTDIRIQGGFVYKKNWIFSMASGFVFVDGVFAPLHLETRYLLKPQKISYYPMVFGGINKKLDTWDGDHKAYSFGAGFGMQEYKFNGNVLAIEAYYMYLRDNIENFNQWGWGWPENIQENNITLTRSYHRVGIRFTYSFM